MFDVLKRVLIPGTTWFLVICATPAVAMLWGGRRLRQIGRILLAALVGWYWLSGLPIVADGLTYLASARVAAARPETAPSNGLPIVILGNGVTSIRESGFELNWPRPQTALNIVAGLERHQADPAAPIVVSGGVGIDHTQASEAATMRDQLVRSGVAPELVLLEDSSTNTREQVNGVAAILRRLGRDRCVLVTSPVQMSRAAAVFRRAGIVATQAPAATEAQNAEANGSSRWLPISEARGASGDAVYELIATVYYRVRGWM